MLWVALFCNNANLLPQTVGFDRDAHADYIVYLQKHRALPLPNEGWEMFQPPLYYGISAATLSTFGLSVTDAAGRHGPAPAHDAFWHRAISRWFF